MAYGISSLGLSWAIGNLRTKDLTGNIKCPCFCHGGHDAGLLCSV